MPAKNKKPADAPVGGGKLVLDEERNTGSVSWRVYYKYLRAIGSLWFIALIAATLIAGQGASVGNSLFLGYWSGSEIKGFSQGQYIAVYAGELGRGSTRSSADDMQVWVEQWLHSRWGFSKDRKVAPDNPCSGQAYTRRSSLACQRHSSCLMVPGTRLCAVRRNGTIEHP